MEAITIEQSNAGKRLDIFLFKSIEKFISRTKVAKLIREKMILVNDSAVKPSYVLREGDAISFKDISIAAPQELIPNENLNIPIIFEDDHFLVIDKPAGVQVHPSDIDSQNTIANWLIFKYPTIKSVGEDSERPGIVHRLDKDTSGLLVIAKEQETYLKFKDLFQKRQIQKTYLALVYGHLNSITGQINKPIARSASFRKQTVAINKRHKGTARESLTYYKVLKEHEGYSLIEAMPKTGRMHQIRIHLASIGHPVIGDKLYTNKTYKNLPNSQRQLLHAHKLSFEMNGTANSFVSKLPQDFSEFLTNTQ